MLRVGKIIFEEEHNQLVIHYQTVNPEKTNTSNTIQTVSTVYTFYELERDQGRRHMGGIGERKEWGKWYNLL